MQEINVIYLSMLKGGKKKTLSNFCQTGCGRIIFRFRIMLLVALFIGCWLRRKERWHGACETVRLLFLTVRVLTLLMNYFFLMESKRQQARKISFCCVFSSVEFKLKGILKTFCNTVQFHLINKTPCVFILNKIGIVLCYNSDWCFFDLWITMAAMTVNLSLWNTFPQIYVHLKAKNTTKDWKSFYCSNKDCLFFFIDIKYTILTVGNGRLSKALAFWLNVRSNLSPTWAACQQRATAWSSPSPPLLFQTHWRVNECVVSIERHVDCDNGNGAPASTKDYFA